MKKIRMYFLAALTLGVVATVGMTVYRAPALYSCMKDEYNLKRDTHFSLIFGSCTIDTPKGRVYVNSLRGFDSNDSSQ